MITAPELSILTHTGRYVSIAGPHPDDIDIEDIAHALANICRFSGHTKQFYSVAEHSVLVALMAPREHGLAALMHDASEAYIGDVVQPLKSSDAMRDYIVAECRMERAIEQRFGFSLFDPEKSAARRAAIKRCDLIMLGIEQRHVMNNTDHWPLLDAVRDDIRLMLNVETLHPKCLSPADARDFFMRVFEFYSAVERV